jgi:hypothetical protein
MNEKIKQLASQVHVTGDPWKNKGEPEYLWFNFREDALEKFAELIVRECMATSDELKAQYLSSRKSATDFVEKNIYAEGEIACNTLRYMMRTRFGIEK